MKKLRIFITLFLGILLVMDSFNIRQRSVPVHVDHGFQPQTDYSDYIRKFIRDDDELVNNGDNSTICKDIDRDGNEELLGVFKQKNIKNALFLIFLRNVEGDLQNLGTVKGDGYNLDMLKLADIDGDGWDEVLFGLKIGSSFNKLNVYNIKSGKFNKLFSKTYSRLDILSKNSRDNTSNQAALAIWLKDIEETYKVQIVKWNGVELLQIDDIYKDYFGSVADYYKKLVEEEPNNAYYWYYLADAQGKAGFKSEGLDSIAKGLSINQEYPTKQQFEELKQIIMKHSIN